MNVIAVNPDKWPYAVVVSYVHSKEIQTVYGPFNTAEEAYDVHDELVKKHAGYTLPLAHRVIRLSQAWNI